jgi:hypothetical protein
MLVFNKKKHFYSSLERLSSRAQTEPPTALMHVTSFTRISVSVDERLNTRMWLLVHNGKFSSPVSTSRMRLGENFMKIQVFWLVTLVDS